jgi:hypothetical protein
MSAVVVAANTTVTSAERRAWRAHRAHRENHAQSEVDPKLREGGRPSHRLGAPTLEQDARHIVVRGDVADELPRARPGCRPAARRRPVALAQKRLRQAAHAELTTACILTLDDTVTEDKRRQTSAPGGDKLPFLIHRLWLIARAEAPKSAPCRACRRRPR